MELKKQEFKLSCSENALVTGLIWECEDPKAIVVLSHGMAEHIERYEPFASVLISQGFKVYGHNHRGHKGSILSDLDYGYMSDEDNFKAMLEDLDKVIDKAKDENPDKKVFIFGHSMGSFLTQRYIELHPNKLDGAIVCGTGMSPKGILGLGRFFAKMIMNSK